MNFFCTGILRQGHTRALSQGQIPSQQVNTTKGHSRTGSRTDFLLPPGHQDRTTTGATAGHHAGGNIIVKLAVLSRLISSKAIQDRPQEPNLSILYDRRGYHG